MRTASLARVRIIDKVAWVHVEDGRVLSTRSAPVDQIIFDWLRDQGLLR